MNRKALFRLLTVLLTLAMVAGMMPTPVWAANTVIDHVPILVTIPTGGASPAISPGVTLPAGAPYRIIDALWLTKGGSEITGTFQKGETTVSRSS